MGSARTPRNALVLGALAAFVACSSLSDSPNNGAVCQAFNDERSRVEVIAQGTVTRNLGIRDGQSGEHEGFLVRLSSACDLRVKVETNTSITGPFTVTQGDRVIVKGEYEYNARGGVIHWTHHDPRGRHMGGYVRVAGKSYF